MMKNRMLSRYILLLLHSHLLKPYVMPRKFDEKWKTKCLKNRFPLPTLLYAGYSVKLKKKRVIQAGKLASKSLFV